MDRYPSQWSEVIQIGLALAATVGGLILLASLIMIGLSGAVPRPEDNNEDNREEETP